MFEVKSIESSSQGSQVNPKVLQLLNEKDKVQERLLDIKRILTANVQEEARLDCMPEEDEELGVMHSVMYDTKDSRAWKPSVPIRFGLYHAFVRNQQSCKREHKLFIVVRGGVQSVTEEIYNMWHDVKMHLTCAKFTQCEELYWAREAVIRNHSRVAAMIAQHLQLDMTLFRDKELPGSDFHPSLKPTTVSFINDIQYNSMRNAVEYVSGGCFTNNSRNGILFDTEGIDGYWLCCGPTVESNAGLYGSQIRETMPYVFPTSAAQFFQKDVCSGYETFINAEGVDVLLPNEKTLQIFEKMGFNRNDEIVYLMDIFSVCNE